MIDPKKYLKIAKKIKNLEENHKTEIKTALWEHEDFIEYTKNKTKWSEEDHNDLLTILDIPKNNNGYYKDKYNQRISYNSIRTLKRPNTEIELSQIHKNEIEKCKNDYKYFRSNYCFIITRTGLARPEPRIYQEELENELITLEDIVILYLI